MSDASPSSLPEPADRISPDDTLPEVKPPTAGFILQLFVIPGIIVFIIIMVWLLFSWLAHMGGNPRSYIDQIKQNRANSWQQAYNLAEELRQNDEYKRDAGLAKEVAAYLDQLLGKPLPPLPEASEFGQRRDPRSEEVARRGFLCKALGEFKVADDALPVLVRAASSHADEDELRIRLSALEAIALLAENVRNAEPGIAAEARSLDAAAVTPMLIRASKSGDHKIALRAAVALAAVGGDEATARLEKMVDEPHHVDVHYNVATGLARNGSAASIDIIVEMLDPDEQRGVASETDKSSRGLKRAIILLNGLRAARELADRNSSADLTPLLIATEKLLERDVNNQVQLEASNTLNALRKRAA